VLLLALGVLLFGTAFGVYARYLGWIDGLPPLPAAFLERRDADVADVPPATTTPTDAKLKKAFPDYCPEVNYNIRIELKAKGVVFAAHDYRIEPDGRVKLWPFSLAALKARRPDDFPDINTVHCDIAYLEFDRPVKKLSEVPDRRIVGCELAGDQNYRTYDPRRGFVHFANNRGTPEPVDDLVLVTPGPVHFHEAADPNAPPEKARPQIETAAVVRLVDKRNQPQATTIDADGMQVYLAGPPPAPDGPAKPTGRTSSYSDVRRVVLPGNVRMNLWMESGSGFLESGSTTAAAPPPAAGRPAPPAKKPPERTNVKITTLGRFTYDVLPDADRARFDRLPPEATNLPDFVRVVRPQARGQDGVVNDQLECDHLELQFAHRPADPPKGAKPKDGQPKARPRAAGMERSSNIEWVHAWGQQVVLTSDEERLEARGNDLFHDAKAKRTTLKGSPEMVAVKDTHEIHAPELVLYGAASSQGQQAEARGPGWLRLKEQKSHGEARWRTLLVYRKQDDQDWITLTGDATFVNTTAGQTLRGDQLKLVLGPDPAPAPPAKKPEPGAPGLPKRRPRTLEAIGHVTAHAQELHVHDTDQLVVVFQDEPPPDPKDGNAPPAGPPPAKPPAGPSPAAAVAAVPGAPKPEGPAKPPVDVTARSVRVLLKRSGEKHLLDNVYCEDRVRIHQDPPSPQQKPIDMRGQRIHLQQVREGDTVANILTVIGSLQEYGQVSFPELKLFGPKVVIDQLNNVALVEGIGGMEIDSRTDLKGDELKQPVPILITWRQNMHFNGLLATFHGNVEAAQQDTSLLCQNMQVFLTRPVALNQAAADRKARGNQPVGVDKVVCDQAGQKVPQPVSITKSQRAARGLVKYERIDADYVEIFNEEKKMHAGPGRVRLWQYGPKGSLGPAAPASRPGPTRPPEEEGKLTLVRYGQALRINNLDRTVKFWGDVNVLHLPNEDPGDGLDMDALLRKLPKDALHLRCKQLTIFSSKLPDGRTHQEMEATGDVLVRWEGEFEGRADTVRFDEDKQQVILEGREDNPAEVRHTRVGGANPGTVVATKFIYNRATGHWTIDGQRTLSSGSTGN
jgi:hypothetical protein